MTDQRNGKPVAGATGFPRLGKRAIEILTILHTSRVVHGYHFVRSCGMPSSTVYTTLERLIKLGAIEREYVVQGGDLTPRDRAENRLPYRITEFGDQLIKAIECGDYTLLSTERRPDTVIRDAMRDPSTRALCETVNAAIIQHLNAIDADVIAWELQHNPDCECEWFDATVHTTKSVRDHVTRLFANDD